MPYFIDVDFRQIPEAEVKTSEPTRLENILLKQADKEQHEWPV